MNSDNILVKLNNVGFSKNDKWLVKDVSLIVEKGKIESSKLLLCQPQIDSSKDGKPRIKFEV